MGRYLDIAQFRAEALIRAPFPHLVMRQFVRPEVLADIVESYPKVDKPGSWPLPGLTYGPAFTGLVEELEGEEVRAAFEQKFDIDLSSKPTMITARGMCRARDGQVHTDSRTKIITVLVYLNQQWESDGGRLRLLGSQDLNDVVAEVPPNAGTVVTFLNTTNAWHGHESYSGVRRVIQLNWVSDAGVVRREQTRHRVSGLFKRLNPFA